MGKTPRYRKIRLAGLLFCLLICSMILFTLISFQIQVRTSIREDSIEFTDDPLGARAHLTLIYPEPLATGISYPVVIACRIIWLYPGIGVSHARVELQWRCDVGIPPSVESVAYYRSILLVDNLTEGESLTLQDHLLVVAPVIDLLPHTTGYLYIGFTCVVSSFQHNTRIGTGEIRKTYVSEMIIGVDAIIFHTHVLMLGNATMVLIANLGITGYITTRRRKASNNGNPRAG